MAVTIYFYHARDLGHSCLNKLKGKITCEKIIFTKYTRMWMMPLEHTISLDVGSYINTIIALRQWEDSSAEDHFIVRFENHDGVKFSLKYKKPNYNCAGYCDGDSDDFRTIGYGYPENEVKPMGKHDLNRLLHQGVTVPHQSENDDHHHSLSHFIAMTSEAARYRLVTAQYVLVLVLDSKLVDFKVLHKHLFKKYNKRRSHTNMIRNNDSHYCADFGSGPITVRDITSHMDTRHGVSEDKINHLKEWAQDVIKADALVRRLTDTNLATVHRRFMLKRWLFDRSDEYQALMEEAGLI